MKRLLLLTALVLALSGCDAESVLPADPKPEPVTVTFEDGRVVDCVQLPSIALSCDWSDR